MFVTEMKVNEAWGLDLKYLAKPSVTNLTGEPADLLPIGTGGLLVAHSAVVDLSDSYN